MKRTRLIYGIFAVLLVFILLALLVAAWLGYQLRGSLALLEGERSLPGLEAAVRVERDAQGIPTIDAQSRADTAQALGFLHAQERYFQMDLLRRRSAGELAALVGEDALESDRRVRVHQFRKRAERAFGAMAPRARRVAEAYTRGVNQGLDSLDARPFPYLILQTDPASWRPEDSMLVLYSMYLDLQPEFNEHERSLAAMADWLPADWYQFLTPEGGQWDSPLQGDARVWNTPLPRRPLATFQEDQQNLAAAWHYRDGIEVGSNNWSVAGDVNGYRAGTVANDMHLGLSVPNIWFRASWSLPGNGRRITGASLPGTPAMVVGSNEHIAWGFTNASGDFHDSILLRVNDDESAYRTPGGWEEFQRETETIAVNGGEPVTVEVKLTRWGPVIGRDHRDRPLALRWVAHDPEGANLNLMRLEHSNSVHEAMHIAATTGMPGQNLNVVDRYGNQAWSIAGRIPKRFGYAKAERSPRQPADWSDGDMGWDGYLHPRHYPRIINPEHGRLWTANARVASGDALETLGRSNYALGARQQQIEKRLFAAESLGEEALLDIALDDEALFLTRWQTLLMAVLDDAEAPELDTLREAVDNWRARAGIDSVGYLAVKRFRETVIDNTVGTVLRALEVRANGEAEPRFWPSHVDNLLEYPVWTLVEQRPERHLPAGHDNWDGFLTAMARNTARGLSEAGPLAEQTWGRHNTLAIQHPLSRALPVLAPWLDMPPEPMPGDTYMPRVQRPASGASERMVVTPGHEDNAIFHMATGQSGHPFSPYFDRGHRDWVEGRPSPFLPGPAQWTLTLQPEPDTR